jgi:hypothetical protein
MRTNVAELSHVGTCQGIGMVDMRRPTTSTVWLVFVPTHELSLTIQCSLCGSVSFPCYLVLQRPFLLTSLTQNSSRFVAIAIAVLTSARWHSGWEKRT